MPQPKPKKGENKTNQSEGDGLMKYRCECLDCGHIVETDEHCRDVECPECGGEMRRKERPGPGQPSRGFRAAEHEGELFELRTGPLPGLSTEGRALDVDWDTGEIKGISLITKGPALGHGFEIDDTTLTQVHDGLKAMGARGMKSRITHPETFGLFGGGEDPLTCYVGRIRNSRREGDQVRVDAQIFNFADNLPGKRGSRKFLLGVAEEDPAGIGMSIVFERDDDEEIRDENGELIGRAVRVKEMVAGDFVGDPAANPGGLLSEGRGQTGPASGSPTRRQEDEEMDKLRTFLAGFGMENAEEATPEQMQAYIEKLGSADRAKVEALESEIAELKSKLDDGGETPSEPVDVEETVKSALARERERVREVLSLAEEHEDIDRSWLEKMAYEGRTKVGVASLIAESEQMRKVGHIAVGADLAREGLEPAISDAILLRAGRTVEEPHTRHRQFLGRSFVETARVWLKSVGYPGADMMLPQEVARTVFNGRAMLGYGHGTADFTNILANTLRKELRQAYEEAAPTWQKWCRRGQLSDFKQADRDQLSGLADLNEVKEGGEYKEVKLSESKEVIQLAKYGYIVSLTWETVINDDLSAFARIVPRMGDAAARKEDQVAYAVLTSNQEMTEDSEDLFDETEHGNDAAVGDQGAPSEASLNTAITAMATQTGLSADVTLGLEPAFLIVPKALRATARKWMRNTYLPGATNEEDNPHRDLAEVVDTAILDSNSTSTWYMAADPARIDTVEVAFLVGETGPTMDQEDGFDTDGRRYKIRHCVTARALDYRGLYRNQG
ncbi:MAG: hypothetical protein R6V58_09975 [Planctomycetota bacterium]